VSDVSECLPDAQTLRIREVVNTSWNASRVVAMHSARIKG
jgi:hypothetical protein